MLERVGEARLGGVPIEAEIYSRAWGAGRVGVERGPGALRRLEWVEVGMPLPGGSKQTSRLGDSVRFEVRLGEMLLAIGDDEAAVPTVAGGEAVSLRIDRFDELRSDLPLRLSLEYDLASNAVEIDEGLAERVPWVEEGGWAAFGEGVVTALAPGELIESDDDWVVGYVERWTGGEPRRVKPYALAKYLASRVMDLYELDRSVEVSGYVGGPVRPRVVLTRGVPAAAAERTQPLRPFSFHGLLAYGAADAVRRGGGGPFDMHNLLCAVYRAAGLPARVVIGFDDRGAFEGEPMAVVSWVEFYLAQPGTDRGEWVPVDIVRQEEAGGRAPALDAPWEFFGRMRDGDRRAAVAVGWTVGESERVALTIPDRVARPGRLWGWTATPVAGAWPWAGSGRTFPRFEGTPRRAGDRERAARAVRAVDRGGEGEEE